MINAVQTTSLLSVIIIVVFIIYIYVEIKSINKNNTVNMKTKLTYGECPDFFETMTRDGKKYCKNTYKLGSCAKSEDNNIISFEDDELFTDDVNGNIMKCKWSKECDIPWNGIDRLC